MGALKAQLISGGRESCAAVALRALFHIQPQHRENVAPYNFIKAAAGRTRRRDVYPKQRERVRNKVYEQRQSVQTTTTWFISRRRFISISQQKPKFAQFAQVKAHPKIFLMFITLPIKSMKYRTKSKMTCLCCQLPVVSEYWTKKKSKISSLRSGKQF